MSSDAQPPSLRLYLKVWVALLIVTVLMVFTREPAVLVPGILLKATLIALFFMHLRHETLDFALTMAICLLGFAAVLFFLIVPDGLAM